MNKPEDGTITLCELANEVEADALLDALEAAGVSGGERRATAATTTTHAAWAILVPADQEDAAKGVFRTFREEHGARDMDACPRCGYALEGLPACETCPECGMSLREYRARATRVVTQVGTEFEAQFAVNLLREGGVGAYCAPGDFMTLYGMGSWNVYVRAADIDAAREVLARAGPMGRRLVERAPARGLERRALAGVLGVMAIVGAGLVMAVIGVNPAVFGVLGGACIAALVIGAVVMWRRGKRAARKSGDRSSGVK